MKILLFILSIFSFVGCAQFKKLTTPTDADIKLDSALIQNFSDALVTAEPLSAPYIASYRYGDKNLVYVAALETEGAGSTTHKSIEKAFVEFAPDFLIIEGSAFTIISDPDDIQYANICEKRQFKYCGEDAFAITMAQKYKVPFSYGEPSDAGLHAVLGKNGVSDDELIAFYALKTIVRSKNTKLSEALIRSSNKFRAKTPMSEARFKKFFKEKMGVAFKLNEINAETISPQINKVPKWANKMAYSIDILRGQYLTRQMESRLNKYKKVLVVYGHAHLLKHKPMLESVFGEPEKLTLTNNP